MDRRCETSAEIPEPEDLVDSAIGRWGLVVLGVLLVGVGVLGAFVPVLPTTCFLLGAACCFGRSSPRLYRWLHENRWFGRYLTEYRVRGRIPRGVKGGSLAVLWTTLAATMLWGVSGMWLRAVLAAVGVGVTAHILSLETTPASRSGACERTDGDDAGEAELGNDQAYPTSASAARGRDR